MMRSVGRFLTRWKRRPIRHSESGERTSASSDAAKSRSWCAGCAIGMANRQVSSFSLELTRRVRDLGWPAAIATPRSALTVPFDGLSEDFRTVLPRLALCALSEAEFLTAIETLWTTASPAL